MKSTITLHFRKWENKPHNENVSTQVDDIRRNSKEGNRLFDGGSKKRKKRKPSRSIAENGRASRAVKMSSERIFANGIAKRTIKNAL